MHYPQINRITSLKSDGIIITEIEKKYLRAGVFRPYYGIWMWKEDTVFEVDSIKFSSKGNTILFLSPFQKVSWLNENIAVRELLFHGDFYCIEYHKNEVACNGLLFNVVYQMPHISVSDACFDEVRAIFDKMKDIDNSEEPFYESVLKSYLQLILAICSNEKAKQVATNNNLPQDEDLILFQNLLEKHFREYRQVQFYTEKLSITPSTLSRKMKMQMRKTPTQIIQERVILEAKKWLHLSTKSIKEIAYDLHFEDVFYFSRYFKKAVGISPNYYRKQVGIAKIAQKVH